MGVGNKRGFTETYLLKDIQYHVSDEIIRFENDAVGLVFDRSSGKWVSLRSLDFEYRIVAEAAVGFKIDGAWMPGQKGMVFLNWEISLDIQARFVSLIRNFQVGQDYVLAEVFTLTPHGPVVRRSLRLHRVGEGESVRLEGFRFTLPSLLIGEASQCVFDNPGPFPYWDKDIGKYLLPETPLESILDQSFPLGIAPDWGFGVMALTNLEQALSLGSWMETGGETNYLYGIEPASTGVTLWYENQRAVRLLSNQVVESDIQTIVIEKSLSEVLAHYRKMAEESLPLAQDAPKWIDKMVLLEAMPEAFPGGFNGLRERLSFYRSLGINTLYLMPHWLGGYGNLDIYAVNPLFGTPGELRRLVQAAHGLDMRVLFDMVIHGFDPDSDVPKKFPEMFFHNEDGSLAKHPTWGTISTDWASPVYQRYMTDLAVHHIQEFGIDGYRMDAASYKGANWDPDLPYPAYRSGCAGRELLQGMLNAMREIKPDAIILNEVFGPAYYPVCDLVHDNMTMGPQMFLERLGEGEASARHYQLHLANVREMLPIGARRVYFARNHDTSWFYHFNGYTPQFLALDAVHAFFGVPEFFAGDPKNGPNPEDEPGLFDFYRAIWSRRSEIPELTAGGFLLREFEWDNDQVFVGARKGDEGTTLVLVSFSLMSESVMIQIKMSIPQTDPCVFDAVSGKSLDCFWLPNGFRIALQPCQAVIVRWKKE